MGRRGRGLAHVEATIKVRKRMPKSKSAPDAICGAPAYRNPAHADLPHVVKMSGGRSSAAMALSLARAGVLKPERSDVVLFANTTAEHPATYKYAAQVCDELEQVHGLPCLWYEYCTIEKATRRGWARRASYRLVTRKPYRKSNPPHRPGYRSDGSSFETLASIRGMLPNRHLRMCTEHLKILPGVEILSEWLSGSHGLAHAGHHYDETLLTAPDAFSSYAGESSEEEYLLTKAKAFEEPPSRPQQDWADFTSISRELLSSEARPKVDIWGRNGRPVQFITLLGLRADEQRRISRMEEQAMFSEGAVRAACRDTSRPAGELTYAPLGEYGVSKGQVMDFWDHQAYDLTISSDFGNCTFCFMKGEQKLGALATAQDSARRKGRPTDIGWWADMEEKYARPSKTRETKFYFLSLSAEKSYASIAAAARKGAYEVITPPPPPPDAGAQMPCDCTD